MAELTAPEIARLISKSHKDTGSAEYYLLEFHADEGRQVISVVRHRTAIAGHEWTPARVGWPARRIISPSDGRIFLAAMKQAIALAARLNKIEYPDRPDLH